MSSKIEFVPSNKAGVMLFYEEHLYQKLKKLFSPNLSKVRLFNHIWKNDRRFFINKALW